MPFKVEPLAKALGTVVTDLDLASQTSPPVLRALIDLLHARGVVVIRDQRLSEADFVRFGEAWGRPLEFFIAEHRSRTFPTLIRIDNDPATPASMRDGAVHWHSDASYEEEPAAVTMLYGQEAPEAGGATSFASTAAAYDALSEPMKIRLEALVAVHRLGMAPWIAGETPPDPNRPPTSMPDQRHPLVMWHPVTGRKAIFTSGTAYAVDGMDPAEATELIRFLRQQVVRPEFRTEYKVVPGDIVLWDNFSTVHRAAPIEYSNEPGKRRLLYRISTKGLPALCSG